MKRHISDKKGFLFKCANNHDKSNFVLNDGRKYNYSEPRFVPYCKRCRTTTPNGYTIINFGNLIYK